MRYYFLFLPSTRKGVIIEMHGFVDVVNYIVSQFASISLFDIADIAIVTVLFYQVYKFVKERRAGKLAVGILFILLAMVLSDFFKMNALNFIISNIVQVGIIGLIILFQSELRSFLEKVGGEPLKGLTGKKDEKVMSRTAACIGIIADAVGDLSAEKTGALIVLERGTKLGDVIKSGTVIDADPSAYLIRTVFFNNSPLHDGAMIVRDGRIFAAGCFLPLSQDETIIKTLGTRHRAALGMSENSDAAVVVVSEETGTVSIAVNGHLMRGLSKGDLISKLEELLLDNENDSGKMEEAARKIGSISKFLPLSKKERPSEGGNGSEDKQKSASAKRNSSGVKKNEDKK